MTREVIEKQKSIRTLLHTATTDNGKEFAGHKDIATALGIDVYFAHPYHSRGRGANEIGASEPIPSDRNLSRCRNDKTNLTSISSLPTLNMRSINLRKPHRKTKRAKLKKFSSEGKV